MAQRAELRELGVRELGVPVLQVFHRVVEPLYLVLGSGLQHTAPNDVLEQLIAGLLEGRRRSSLAATISMFGH